MKYFNVSPVILMFFSFLFFGTLYGQTAGLTGEFIHVPNSKRIFLEKIHNGILFKSKPNQNWIFFEKKGQSVYIDKRGNRIETISDEEIVFVKRNSRRGLHFNKIPTERKSFQSSVNENIVTQRPEGLWFDEKTETYLIVVETRDGIKVRLKDSRLWYEYKSKNQNHVFESFDGKKYIWNGLEMEYFHTDNQFKLHFYKIADDFDGY